MTEEQVAEAVVRKMRAREIGDLVFNPDGSVLGVITELRPDCEVIQTSGVISVKADQIGLLYPR